MNRQEAKIRIEKLRKEIGHYRYLYHVLDKEEISDAALDSLKNELFKLEMEYPEFITSDSPTQRIGGKPLEKFEKVRHSTPMMSLFDSFSEKDIKDWEERIKKIIPNEKTNYYCELKMDGLAISLIYNKGKLITAATRGDGQVGEDVTQNLKTIESIPLSLRIPEKQELKKIGFNEREAGKILKAVKEGKIEIRGEAIMTKKVFNELNNKLKKEGKAVLANPRNAAAGSIRQLNSKITSSRKLDFYTYAIVSDLGFSTHIQEHNLAKILGLKTLNQNKFAKDIEEVIKFHDYWEDNRDEVPFECDGVVVVVNNLSLWPKLGIVGKGPRYMMAYKFAAEQATTKVEDINWQVGRTGILTPTAVLTPVKVGGVTVSRATLHNMDEIKRLKLKIGDTVILERAGDVIPKVVKIFEKLRTGNEKEINPPKKCHICGGEVIKISGEVAYKCISKNCYARNLRALMHWASKGALDIEGLGPKIIEQLIKDGLVNNISDFYKLSKDDLLPLERFADKSAENLIKSINDKKIIPLEKFIYGLGILHVGEETAILLSQNIKLKSPKISDFLNVMNKMRLEDYKKFSDIGPVVAKSIYDWFHDKININLLNNIEKNKVSLILPNVKKIKMKYNGKIFVLTGALKSLTRDEAKARIRELGGDVSSSVSKNTDYIIAGEEAGSKLQNAKKLGVKIIDEENFLKMIK